MVFAAVPYLGGAAVAGQAIGQRPWVGTIEEAARSFRHQPNERRTTMPILLWLLGAPISLIIILLLFGVV